MANVHCNIRNSRTLILLAIACVAVYAPLKALYTLSSGPSTADSALAQAVSISGHPIKLAGDVRNVMIGSDGKLEVVISLDMKDIMKFAEGAVQEGEATANAIPGNVSFVMHNPTLCTEEPNLKYIIYVHTSPGNALRRENIRATWASKKLFKDRRTKLVFLTGKADAKNDVELLKHEFDLHKDIVVGDFLDHYRNLTLKGIMGLKWLTEYCGNAAYAIKADDDAFVNIFEVMRIVDRYKASKRLTVCPLWKDNSMPILRDPKKCMKWCVKYTEFPGRNYFPKYCAGLSFTLSRDLVVEMYSRVRETPFFWIDDVYITGLLLGKVADVDYIDLLKNFTLKEDLAVEQYTDPTHPISLYYVHIKKQENFSKMWQTLLERTPIEDLQSLDEGAIADFPTVKQRLVDTPQIGDIVQGGAR